MNITEYQNNIYEFASYHKELGPFQVILSLMNNVGILSGKLNDMLENNDPNFNEEDKIKIAISLGDILHNIANIASDLNMTLDEVIALNLKKVELQQKNKLTKVE